MKFEKKDYLLAHNGKAWFSDCGKYKIVSYGAIAPCSIKMGQKISYASYYRLPCGQFGDHVEKGTPFYKTLKEAKRACASRG